jgi:hypothetical protein
VSTYPGTKDISSLAASSNGKRRVKEFHLDANFGSVTTMLEALTRLVISAGGVAAPGTVTIAGATVRVQDRVGATQDGRAALALVDETIDLASVATGVKCRVVISPSAVTQAYQFVDPETSETITHTMTVRLGKLEVLQGDASTYPAVPAYAVPVRKVTRTVGGLQDDGAEDTAPTFRSVASLQAPTYDIAAPLEGKPTASQKLLMFAAPRALTILNVPASGAHRALADTAATASTTFTIKQGSTTVGSIVFAAGSAVGTVSLTATVNLAAGDKLTIVAPASPDATLADLYVTLVAAVA